MRNYDLEFLKRFSMVMAFLIALAVLLIFLSKHLSNTIPPEVLPSAQAQVENRIAPQGTVYAGAEGEELKIASADAALARAKANVAFGGSLDGKVIYDGLCGACHTSGSGGAPTLAGGQFKARLSKGEDLLIKHAIEGFTGAAGVMPARGGNPSVSDEQIKATVEWMLAQ